MTMPETKKAKTSHDDAADMFGAVNNLANQLQAIDTFIKRRFDEISMEINATSQQVDMAEEGIVRRFTEVLDVLKAISFSGDGSTPANTGVELDAVVEMTEAAANRILDAADRISSRLKEKTDWDKAENREHTMENISKDIEEIFMACSFQDITGQRIRKTLDNLRMIEERLSTALGKMGIQIDAHAGGDMTAKAATQDDIDSLFSSSKKSSS